MTIGEKIKEVRKAHNMTQQELAKKLGVTPSMISQYEKGKRNPKFDTLCDIARAIGVDPFLDFFDDAYSIFKIYPKEAEELRDFINKTTITEIFELYLNEKGKEKVIEYARDISMIPDYRKPSAPDSAPEEYQDYLPGS